jgi:hypothetical protein
MRINELAGIIQKHNYFPKYSKWIFILLFLTCSAIYNYQDILFKSPQSIHLWRQCDCLSITLNYYQDNNPFFEPSIHNLGADGTGKTVSDFPLIYFLVAELWKVFGYHEFIYRLIVVLFFFSGLFALFKIFENILKDSVLAITGALFLFTSPALVYYANNFLMDIPAFSLAIIGLYFFFRFSRSSANKHFYLFVFFYAVAGLLKISSLLSFAAIMGIFVLELFNVKLNPDKKIFQYPVKQFLLLISVVMIQVIWYLYANHYNAKHNGGIFLIGTLPIWDLSIDQIKLTLDAINEHIRWDYFRKETLFVFVFMLVSVMVFYKRINKIIFLLTMAILAGFLIFILLFFQALKDHDYYTINLFILIPFVILSFLLLLKDKFNKVYISVLFRILIIAFLVHNIDFARRRIEGRYSAKGWQNENYIENIQPFKEITPYLQSIGIKKDDRVISLSDNSINITLYFMNQKGWTNYGISGDSAKIKEVINLGAKYLFIYDKEIYKEQSIQPFLNNRIGEFKNIDIYAL